MKGYTLNEERIKQHVNSIKEIETTLSVIKKVISKATIEKEEIYDLLQVVSDYTRALILLDQYDHNSLSISNTQEEDFYVLEYQELAFL